MTRFGLITRIALLVVGVEVAAFGSLGWFYVDHYRNAVDDNLRSRMLLVGRMVANSELPTSAIASQSLMSEIIGAPFISGMVIGGNGRVIVATDSTYLGRQASQVPGFDVAWAQLNAPDNQFVVERGTLTSIKHVHAPEGGNPLYITAIKVSTTELDALKRSIALWGQLGSLLFILLSSAGIVYIAQRLITRRIDTSLGVLKAIENGQLGERIPIDSNDELAQLQNGINSMTAKVGSLLEQHRRSAEELQVQKELLVSVIENTPIRVFWKDRESRYLGANSQFAHDAGFAEPHALVGMTDFDMGWREQAEAYRADDRLVMASGQAKLNFEEPQSTPDGRIIWLNTSKVPLRGKDTEVIGVLGIYDDITARKLAEERLRQAASVFENANECIMITAPDGAIVDVNEAFTRVTGYGRDEVLGKNPRILNAGLEDQAIFASLWRHLVEDGHWDGELWNRRKNGEAYPAMLTISAVPDANGQTQRYVALFSDITALKEQQRQLEHIAHYDALTGLPNRVLLADRLNQAMAQTLRRSQKLAVAYLDLDGFKAVNDSHGHDAGDQLLTTVSTRMKHALRDGDTLARLGGDEFVAVLLDLAGDDTCEPMLDRLLAAVAEPFTEHGLNVRISASLGVTLYPQSEEVDADQLLRQADQAMYQAKLTGKNRYHIFDFDQDRSLRGHHESLEHIRLALSRNEFVLHYQPKVNMRTGEVLGVEALIRWQHPEHGLLPPGAFLPVIENHPISVELGDWVLETALNQIEAWKSSGLNLPISVNVDAMQIQQPDFISRLVVRLAAHTKVNEGDLELEILETSALADIDQVSRVIEECLQIGVDFALDDFGTGYSSLTYLKRLPARLLKIDQSFVRDMLDDPEDMAILEGVLGLAKAFRREAIAEGVETIEHGEMLLKLGCELAQGYVIARPMPGGAMAHWLANWQTAPSWRGVNEMNRDDFPVLFAAVEHRHWVATLESLLRNERTALPIDHHSCRFGLWLEGEGKARYGMHLGFVRLSALHRDVHRCAQELLALRDQGRADVALQRIGELHALRDQLLAELGQLSHTTEVFGPV